MKTRIRYFLTFLSGAIYFWALSIMTSPNIEDISAPSAIIAAFIVLGGGAFIVYQIIFFIISVWSTDEWDN